MNRGSSETSSAPVVGAKQDAAAATLGHIEVGNCPTCGAFPVQHIAEKGPDHAKTVYRFEGGYTAAERASLLEQNRVLAERNAALVAVLEKMRDAYVNGATGSYRQELVRECDAALAKSQGGQP